MNHLQPFALHEGLSKLLYHFTDLRAVSGILTSNEIGTSGALGTEADMWKNNGKAFYLSAQRSKNAKIGWAKGHMSACLVLDGEALQQTEAGRPADYFGWSRKRADWDSEATYRLALTSTELEDRVVTDKPALAPATKYIKEIHVLVNPAGTNQQKNLDTIHQQCQQKNLPLFLYTDEQAAMHQDKRKAVAYAPDLYTEEAPEPYVPFGTDIERDYRSMSSLMVLLAVGDAKAFGDLKAQLTPELRDKFVELYWDSEENYRYGYRADEDYTSIAADIHNTKTRRTPLVRFVLTLLVQQIRRHKVKSLKQLIYVKAGIPLPPKRPALTPKGKEWKPEFVRALYLEDEPGNWNKRIWNWISQDEFWAALPEDFRYRADKVKKGKTRHYATELINDEEATFKQAYNLLLKHLGRVNADETFAKCYMRVAKEPKPKKKSWE